MSGSSPISFNVMTARRPAYFANRVLRLATKTALAQHIGTDAFALLCVIAMTEDARRYRGAVVFWNEQLLPLVGFAKWERLDRARKALIDAGWLAYEAGGRHRPGRYRVTIPHDLEDVGDTAVDECSAPSKGYREGDQEGVETGIKPESRRVSKGSRAGDREGEPSCLDPLPKTSTSTSEDWPAVEAELFGLGLKAAGGTVTLARERGFTPERVRQAIAFWQKHPEWGPGAIHEHIKHTPPSVTAEHGWWPESKDTSQTVSASKRLADANRLSEMTHDDLREVLKWGVDGGLVRPMPLEQFNDDPDHFLKIIPNQALLVKLLSARDDATKNVAPTAQPPPSVSSPPKRERTPHGNEASALRSAQSP